MYSQSDILHEVPYQNQLQFNLRVPLTTQNLVTHFHQPSPIMIERVGGQGHNAIPGGVKQPGGNLNVSAVSSCNYSMLSEDKMAKMSLLAQRDLKNMKLRDQIRENNSVNESRGHPLVQGRQRPAGNATCSRQRRAVTTGTSARQSARTKEAVKNRPVGGVQTPRPRRPVSHTAQAEGDSIAPGANNSSTGNKDTFFPVKANSQSKDIEPPKDDLGKVQLEIEESLKLLTQIAERILEDGNTQFLRPAVRVKKKDGFLYQEESLGRAQLRSEEQNTRFARTLYNMRQRVKQLQRETTLVDLNIPTQKRHVQSQLVATYRGVSRALQTFVNQLAYQDLTYGLPTQCTELNLLVHQLATLTSVIGQESHSHGQSRILHILNELDGINSRWSSQYLQGARQMYGGGKKSAVNKEWVSDTKVEPNLFSKMETALRLAHGPAPSHKASHHQQQQKIPPQHRGRPAKRAQGKENRGGGGGVRFQDKRAPSAKTGTSALCGQSQVGFVPVGGGNGQPTPSVAWEVNLGKSYMLPTNLIAQREKAQRAVELSKQNATNFSQSTITSRLRSSPHRPNSAPASQSRRKEVNFDLEPKSLLPWIPAGAGSYRHRSSSLEQRSFYLKDSDTSLMGQAALNLSPTAGSLKVCGRDRGDTPEYGFKSLPSYQQLRAHQVSDSFLECVEKRLLDRMMQRRVADGRGSSQRADQMTQSLHVEDQALDITDLYVEGDSSLNETRADEFIKKEAVSLMDAPTLENIKLRLDNMQRKEKEIRSRWSTLKFADTKPLTRKTHHNDDDDILEPVGLHIQRQTQPKKNKPSDFNKPWSEDPLLFTKSFLTNRNHTRNAGLPVQTHVQPAKQLVSVKQTFVERILADRDRFDSYLRRKSHHPSGKFDPWTLVEEISDEILSDCLRDVSEEVEKINEEIANHMYKSEFMVTNSPSVNNLISPQVEHHHAIPRQNTFDTHAVSVGDASDRAQHSHQSDALQTGRHQGDEDGLVDATPHQTDHHEGRAGRAIEPLLEDISHFMSVRSGGDSQDRSKEDNILTGRTEVSGSGNQDSRKDDEEDEEEEEDDDDDENDDDDDDDGNYSDDDFEDVSDVEL